MQSFFRLPESIRRRYKTVYGASVVGLFVTLLCLFWLQNQQVVLQAELRGYDTLFYLRGGLTVPRNIVVVGVDDASLATVANNRWPLPRTYMADAINFLHRAHAKAIGLDFQYFNDSIYGPADDKKMAAAIRRAGNVVIQDEIGSGSASNYIQSEQSITEPIPKFARGAAAIGTLNIAPDADLINRWVPLMQDGPGGANGALRKYPAFGLAMASVALHKPVSAIAAHFPQGMYINFVGQQRPMEPQDLSFPTYQFASLALGDAPYSPFRNKIVILIADTVRSGDLHETPVGQMFGGYIMANVVNTILRDIPITPLGNRTNDLILLLAGLSVAFAASRFGIGWSTVASAAIAGGFFAAGALLFQHFRVWMHVVTPEITIVLVYAAVMAFRFATEERLKRRIKSSFSLYLKPEIVELISQSPDPESVLAASRRPLSALFVDIRGFTAMSERMQPEAVVAALDVYLEELTASVQKYNGTVNKYVGDEIIGVWNCVYVQPQPDHAMLAVECALDMVASMDGINAQLRAKGLPAVKYGIGINSGEAVVGQMGSSFRKQFDVIGDVMNTAARLCSAAGGGEIIISQATWESIGDQLVLEETEPLRLKGKSEPMRTFAVLGISSAERAAAPLPMAASSVAD